MTKKIKEYHFWSLRNIFISIGVIISLSVFLVLFFSYPLWYDYLKKGQFDSEIEGRIESVTARKIIRQSRIGSDVKIDHYSVKYNYTVDGQLYEAIDKVNWTKNKEMRLNQILNSKERKVKVLYSIKNPQKSTISLTDK